MTPIEIQEVFGKKRSVYRNVDGQVVLADLCTCWKDPLTCPIDDHAIRARQNDIEKSA